MVSYFLWSISYDFTIFVLARIVGGISKGNVSLSMAIVTDLSSVSNRGAGMVNVFSLSSTHHNPATNFNFMPVKNLIYQALKCLMQIDYPSS